jgi:hypothetical protein
MTLKIIWDLKILLINHEIFSILKAGGFSTP